MHLNIPLLSLLTHTLSFSPTPPSCLPSTLTDRIAFFAAVYLLHLSLKAFASTNLTFNLHSPIIIFIASVIFMATSADALDHHNYTDADRCKWAVACGTISTFFTLMQLILLYVGVNFASEIAKPLSIFLVCLWAPGAGVSTSIKGEIYRISMIIGTRSLYIS